MSLVSLLQAEERNKVKFDALQFPRIRCLDISVYEGQHTKYRDVAFHEFVESRMATGRTARDRLCRREAIPTDETGTIVESLKEWIVAQGCLGADEYDKDHRKRRFRGALRLLYVPWPRFEINRARGPVLPFSEHGFALLRREIALPQCFLADLARGSSFPATFEKVPHVAGNKLGISGSRSTGDTRLEYVISFDKTTCITSGYLSFSSEAGAPSQLIERLHQAPELAVNPMLLPALANNAWASMMTKDCWIAHGIIRQKIEEETGLMKSYLKDHINISGVENQLGEREQQARYHHIHEAIVSEHAYLCNGLSDFVKDDGEAILAKLKNHDDLQENACLQMFMERRIQNTRIDLQLRERLLEKLHMQLQVLYSLMQQRDNQVNIEIAKETKRDSSAMKTLALITVLFLPLTAIAAIFSMGTFFDSEDGRNKNRIQVSPKFWIFWCVVGPLTIVILATWGLWINRKQAFPCWYSRRLASRKQSLENHERHPKEKKDRVGHLKSDIESIDSE